MGTVFTPNTVIRSSEINANFDEKANLASPTFTGTLTAAIVNATTIIGTTITATSLVTTTLTAASIQTTSITSSSINGTTITGSSIVGTTITATTLVSTSLTVSSAINLTGGQIAFPASMVASANGNTLDDFEEGTSTPTVSSVAGTITTASATLRYVKIGKTVWAHAIVTVTNAGTGTGLRFSLPFTVSAVTFTGSGREVSATGNSLNMELVASGTLANISTYNNGNACVTGYVCNVFFRFET